MHNVTKCCIVGYGTGALWDLCNRFIRAWLSDYILLFNMHVICCPCPKANLLTHWPLGDLNFKNVIFNLDLLNGIFKSFYDNVLRWMPQDLTDGKSTLVQVMAWCRQATSHYLNQCWPRSPMSYGVTRPQWVNKRWLLFRPTIRSYYNMVQI